MVENPCPGYLNQSPIPLTRSFAGILVDHNSSFNLGGGGPNPGTTNTFHDMNFGVIAKRSNLQIENYSFQNIIDYDSYSLGQNQGGSAVFVKGNVSNSSLVMYGRKSATDPDIEGCQFGVNSLGSNIDIQHNQIVNCDKGVYISSGNNLRIAVIDNYIDCNAIGVGLLHNRQNDGCLIRENEIHCGIRPFRVDGFTSNAFGIITADYNVPNSNSIINGNQIHLYDKGAMGIRLYAADEYIVNFNEISFATIETINATQVDLLSIANDEIASSDVYVQNEQLVNDIYFGYIENNNPQVIHDKASDILSVALQCPLAGGPAVHRARSLYLLIDPEMEYNDGATCLLSGWLLRKSATKSIPLGIYPNPASTEVTITYSLENEQVLQIIDNFGRVTMQIVLKPEQNSITPDISDLCSGIYTIQILGGNEMQKGIGRNKWTNL